jgi:hypothetical protein
MTGHLTDGLFVFAKLHLALRLVSLARNCVISSVGQMQAGQGFPSLHKWLII